MASSSALAVISWSILSAVGEFTSTPDAAAAATAFARCALPSRRMRSASTCAAPCSARASASAWSAANLAFASSWLAAVSWPYMVRSEEQTSELQSLMRISYAVFCLQKQTRLNQQNYTPNQMHHHDISLTLKQ